MNTQVNKFHKIGEFRKVVKYVTESTQFQGLDSSNKPIFDPSVKLPIINYTGTVKMHGTNGSIVLSEDGTISFHSKDNLLGQVSSDGKFQLHMDNYDFAKTMYTRMAGVTEVVHAAKKLLGDRLVYPLRLSGEWIGDNITKGVSISDLPVKTFVIFGIKSGHTDLTTRRSWLPMRLIAGIEANEYSIYNINQFKLFQVAIDFNNPELIQNKLVECAMSVEDNCPIAKFFNLPGRLTGEGVVFTPDDPNYIWETRTWFKVKGKKHSSTKVKTLATVCPEKLNTINQFISYSVTTNRLEQGLREIGLSKELTGEFIKWVIKDITLEEVDTLEYNELTINDVTKAISKVASKFYLTELNNQSI